MGCQAESPSESAQTQTKPDPHSNRSESKKRAADGVLRALQLTKDLSDAFPPLKMAATVLIEVVEIYQVCSSIMRHPRPPVLLVYNMNAA